MAGRICLTIAAALFGAFAGRKLRLPAAFMTGSMLAVILMNAVTDMAYCPTTAKPYVQLVAGTYIAMGITRQTVRDMGRILKPLAAYLGCLIIWALSCGAFMRIAGGLDTVTAFLACVPGGLTDISLISMDMGANTPQVTTLQTLRMIMAVGLFPILTRWFVGRFGHAFVINSQEQKADGGQQRNSKQAHTPVNALLSLCIGAAGAYLGLRIGFPSAALTGAMIAAAAWNVFSGKTYVPVELRKVTQVVAGGMVGSMVTRGDLRSLVTMSAPLFIIIGEYLIFDFVIAPMLAKLFRMDLLTMILACTPAGASDMALIAGDMGGAISEVAVFHVVRLCVVLTVFPAVIQQIAAVW